MRILHISWSDHYGGAAKAAYNLHTLLLREGVDSHMLVQKRYHKHPSVHTYDNLLIRFLSRLNPYLDHLSLFGYRLSPDNFFTNARLSLFSLKRKARKLKPDIIHFHWIGKGCFSLLNMADIDIPVFITLHDSWFFTGGCHIVGSCLSFQSKCGCCPALNSSTLDDPSTFNFRLKEYVYSKIKNLSVIGVSSWMSQQAVSSFLLGEKLITTVPNPIDIQLFKPPTGKNKTNRSTFYNNLKNILIGGFDLTSDQNKGFHLFKESLIQLSREFEISLFVFGDDTDFNRFNLPCKVTSFGQIEDRQFLANLYATADVTVVPSLQESFCQVAAESISCGTPVVAFSTSGLLDIVVHKHNGYLATPFCASSLASGIRWVLHHKDPSLICNNARSIAVSRFSCDIVAKRLISMYSNKISS